MRVLAITRTNRNVHPPNRNNNPGLRGIARAAPRVHDPVAQPHRNPLPAFGGQFQQPPDPMPQQYIVNGNFIQPEYGRPAAQLVGFNYEPVPQGVVVPQPIPPPQYPAPPQDLPPAPQPNPVPQGAAVPQPIPPPQYPVPPQDVPPPSQYPVPPQDLPPAPQPNPFPQGAVEPQPNPPPQYFAPQELPAVPQPNPVPQYSPQPQSSPSPQYPLPAQNVLSPEPNPSQYLPTPSNGTRKKTKLNKRNPKNFQPRAGCSWYSDEIINLDSDEEPVPKKKSKKQTVAARENRSK